MTEPQTQITLWQRALNKGAEILRPLMGKSAASVASDGPVQPDAEIPCCGSDVHIAYRGKSDDRMYMAYNRRWQEVQYYQPNGLRVFCGKCRRRVY